ncbi:MAG: DUF4260 domain-containing protein [Candidatus Limnocylindrales bacterium]
MVVPDTVRFWLHAEGAAAFIAAALAYNALGGNWWLFVPLLLLPDISAAGYLLGPRVGAFTYNLAHNWVVGLGAVGLGYWLASDALLFVGILLVAHVGADRAIGYGLKHVSGFKDTHLQRA